MLSDTLVLIPAFDCSSSIKELIDDTKKYISESNILVIDDGSSDNTADIVRESGINLISHHTNLGKGAALQTGFAYFLDEKKYNYVITIDGDLQHPPEFIPEITSMLSNGSDIVMGNRMHETKQMPIQRVFSNSFSSWGISVVLKDKLPDTQCGLRGMKRWVIENIDLTSTRYAIETEVALKAGFIGAKFDHIEIPTIYNGNPSHIKPFRITWEISKVIFSFFFKSRFGKLKKADRNDFINKG